MRQMETTQDRAGSADGGARAASTAPATTAPQANVMRARAAAWFPFAVAGVVALALLLRLPTLSGRSVWMDEAYSYWFSHLSWTDLWTKTPAYETHPPFYYSLLKLWTAWAGTSEAGMRSLSVLASVVTVALTAFAPRLLRLPKRYGSVGIAAAALLAVNEGNIEYAQQARPYALQTLFCTLLILLTASMLRRMFDARREHARIEHGVRLAVLSGIAGGIVLWLHNTSPFIIFSNSVASFAAIMLFSRYRRADLLLAAGSLALSLLVWSPCVPILLIESRTVASAFWVTISPKMLIWPYTLAAGGKYAFIPAAAVAVLAWLGMFRDNRGLAIHAASMLLLPVLCIFTISYLFTPVFITRTFAWMAPLFLFVVSLGLFGAIPSPGLRHGLLAVLIALGLVQCVGYYRTPTEDLRGAVRYLRDNVRAGDAVLLYPNEMEVGLHYYARHLAHPFELAAIPARYPALGLKRPYLGSNKGAPAAIESDRAQIDALLATHPRVWLVGAWQDADGVPNVVGSELVRQRGKPAASADFFGIGIALFGK